MPYPTTSWTDTPTPPTTTYTDAAPSPAATDPCDYKQASDGGQSWIISRTADWICQLQFPIEDMDAGTVYALTP